MASLKCDAGDTDGERTLHCQNISELSDKLGSQVLMLGNLYRRTGLYEDALYCYSFMQDMLNSMYRDDDYRPPFIFSARPLYCFPAYCLMKLGRGDEAVDMLEKCVLSVKAEAAGYNKTLSMNSPMLRDCTYSYGFGGDADYPDVKKKLTEYIVTDDFGPLEENPRYRELVKAITE